MLTPERRAQIEAIFEEAPVIQELLSEIDRLHVDAKALKAGQLAEILGIPEEKIIGGRDIELRWHSVPGDIALLASRAFGVKLEWLYDDRGDSYYDAIYRSFEDQKES